jgi:type IV pilus assembly protein PilZ
VEEKRAHRRVEYSTEITCTPEGGESFVARSHDLSLGGMFVESEHNPTFGTKMTIRVLLPGQSAPFDLPCTVRWNKPEGFGVQFGRLGAKETHAITKLT